MSQERNPTRFVAGPKNTGHCKIVKKVLPNGVEIKTIADPDDCPFFEPKKKKVEKPPKVVRAPIDFDLVRKLYERGMNDREIGEEAECSGCVVWKWRKKNKLPPNKRKKPY